MKNKLSAKIAAILLSLCFLRAQAHAASENQPMPDFVGISHWLNTAKPLTAQDLKGKVVLIDFWTYSCVNCLRTLPHLETWYQRYQSQGLVIIGVHSPEFEFEKELPNVQMALKKYGITYPVAMDNDLKTWDAYSNRYWPAHYFIDRQGIIRYEHFGEGDYDESESHLRALLSEGKPKLAAALPPVSDDVDLDKINSPEMYVGLSRLEYFGNKAPVNEGKPQDFTAPQTLRLNHFYFSGKWQMTQEFSQTESAGAQILLSFDSSRANLVLSAPQQSVTAEILIDGKPATLSNKGKDVKISNGRALCVIAKPRLYNLTHASYGQHTLIIKFLAPHARAYAFTFG